MVLNGEFAYNKSTSDGYPFGAVKRLDLYEKGVLSTLYIVFAPKKEQQIDSDYLTVFFDTDRWHKGVAERAAEGARNHGLLNISAEDFFDIDLSVPKDIVEQKQIGAFIRQLDSLITLHQCKQNHKKEALMSYTLTKYEKETVLLYNQSHDPITISTYDPGLRRRLREFAARYPEMCRRVDKQKYPDYAEYEIQKDRVSIRLLPPMSEEKRRAASEKAKAAGLGTKTDA